MSADRELLELAAKAAGMPLWPGDAWRALTKHSGLLRANGCDLWNPLADDGDALRLAAVLKIDLEWQATSMHPAPEIEAYRRDDEAGSFYCANEHEDDYRRAIVRAAAEIGRATTQTESEKP